jgi:hypothetical protein
MTNDLVSGLTTARVLAVLGSIAMATVMVVTVAL